MTPPTGNAAAISIDPYLVTVAGDLPMKVVYFYTGQGVAGNMANFCFYTGQFSSCSPLVMYNENTNVGGAYHLPGKIGNRPELLQEWDSTISAMLEYIKPTVVRVFPAGYASESMGGAKGLEGFGDRDVLKELFEKHKSVHKLDYAVEVDNAGRSGICVSAVGKKLQFSPWAPEDADEHDLKKRTVEPDGCKVFNLKIDYAKWGTLS